MRLTLQLALLQIPSYWNLDSSQLSKLLIQGSLKFLHLILLMFLYLFIDFLSV